MNQGLNRRIGAPQRPLHRCLRRDATARSSSPGSRDGSSGSGAESPQVPEPDSAREPLTSRRRALLSLPTAAAGSSLAVNGSRAAPAAAVADAAAAGGKPEAVSRAAACLPLGIQAIRDPTLNRGLATAPEVTARARRTTLCTLMSILASLKRKNIVPWRGRR